MTETAALQKPMTGFHLKLIALTTMFIDHIGAVFFPQVTLLRVIGRISFPLYAFLIAEGCRYTRNRGRYALGLGVFALISEIPYDLALHPEFLEYGLWGQNFLFQTNIFYTMFFAVASVHIFEVLRRRSWKAQLAALGSFAGVCLLSVLLYNAGRSAHGPAPPQPGPAPPAPACRADSGSPGAPAQHPEGRSSREPMLSIRRPGPSGSWPDRAGTSAARPMRRSWCCTGWHKGGPAAAGQPTGY